MDPSLSSDRTGWTSVLVSQLRSLPSLSTSLDKSVGGRAAMSSCSGKDGRALSLEKGVPLARVKGRIDHFLPDSNGHSADV
jgi:hypothetical protein